MREVSEGSKRWQSNLDLIRILSAIAVVWLHVSASVVVTFPSVGNLDWWIGNFADSFSRWCVPLFVMLTGALLIPKARATTPTKFIVERLPRILIITFSWTIIYGFFALRYMTPIELVKATIKGIPFFHLWYMYMLIGLYVFVPFLQRLMDSLDRSSLTVFIFASFCVASSSSILATFYPSVSIFSTMFLPYIGYLCLGYISLGCLSMIRTRTLILGILFSGGTIAILTGILLPTLGNKSWDLMYGYLNPAVILMSICVFHLALKSTYRGKILELAPLTLGIYLIHPFILIVLNKIGVNGFLLGPLFGIPFTTFVAFFISGGLTCLLKKSSIGAKIV